MPSTITDRVYGESSGVAVKAPCVAVAVVPDALNGLETLGGYALQVNDRVLVIAQVDPTTNGIYNASTSAWTRAGDFDGVNDCVQGTLVPVVYPNATGLIFQLTTQNPIIGTTPLIFTSYQNLNPGLLYPIAAWEAGLNVVAMQYPYGHLLRYGAYLNGANDDSVPWQNAAIGGQGIVICPAGTSYITQVITLPYVDLILQGEVLITGSGYVRGVLTNEKIPHAAFQVGYNLVTVKERSPAVMAGANFYLDPLLGSDTNGGTTATTPVQTITKMLSLIAAVANTAANLLICVRSGRLEQPLGGIQFTNAVTLTSGGAVAWTPNPGDAKPVITPTLYWLFQSSQKTTSYTGQGAVANPSPSAFVDLWDAETGLPVECANNLGPNYSLPRNQVANVTLTGAASPFTISITPTADDVAAFNAMTVTEQAGAQLRLHHSYTTSWHDNLSLAGGVLSGNGYTNNSAYYYNGWATVGLPFGAPYLLRNIKGYLNGRNFCAYSNNVYLPNYGTNFFTTDQTATAVVSLGAAANHTFTGFKFRYQSAQMSTLAQLWVPAPFPQAGAIGLLVGGSGANQGAFNCDFEDGAYSGFILGYANSQALRNRCNRIGLTGINYTNTQALGCGGAIVKWNATRRCGHFSSAAGRGIHVGGVNVTVSKNDCRNGGTTAIHFDSGGNITGFPPGASGTLQNNVALENAIIDGKPAMLYALNDAGAIYWFGGLASAFNLNVLGNVSGRTFSTSAAYNFYGDGGCNGVQVDGNLAWGAPTRAFIMEQNGGNTYNDSVRNNFFLGNVHLDSNASGNSDFSNNVVSCVRGNVLTPTYVVAVEPNQYGVRATGNADYVEVWQEDPAIALLTSGSLGTIWEIDPFVMNFVRQVASIDPEGPTWSSDTLLVLTASGSFADYVEDIIWNSGATGVLQFASGWGNGGRDITVKTLGGAVNASAAVIAPQNSQTFAAAILPATAGAWARLKGDGLGNWYIMESGT